ncbi:MAG TPA: NrfD/PsrC family molybdoenzyme membrane anchor subunit [Terriglobia bacterium]|nr:NrfD/PsrC family molybdoenzyme membrane anchor subunit [Terriglobia bacterium]
MNPSEVSVIGANPGISPSLHIWGWEIAAYLFLGGLVAGLLVISGLAHRKSERPAESLAWRGPALVPVLLTVGMVSLFLDLEHKLHFYRFYLAFRITSPMSWGAWILLLVYPASILFALAAVGEFGPKLPGDWDLVTELAAAVRRPLAAVNVALGVALGIYTGILLSSLGARPFWNTPLLGPLFLLSGLSGGAALLILLEPSREAQLRLGMLDVKLIGAESATLALILIGLSSGGAAQRAAAQLVLGGSFTAVFWIAIVMMGLALPATIELFHRFKRAQASFYPAALVLLGGFALRMIILLAGQASRWGTLQ